ncbi:MAG: hypothetical protein M3Y24_00495 [Acidobacteriota bacterium]|nr:hypothetical protein [Acidobacteriota bacterium]
MLPAQLSAEQFAGYPPQARQIAVDHLAVLQQLPLSFIPLLLRETIAYDWRFPAERKELDRQFAYLSAQSKDNLQSVMAAFTRLTLSPALERIDWVNKPADFSEQLTAHLWATHQIDAFRSASVDYVHKMNAAKPEKSAPVNRLAIAIIGQGVTKTDIPLFRKLRPYGTYFKNVNPESGRAILLGSAVSRAEKHREDFAHWYIDGTSGESRQIGALTSISYSSVEPMRLALIAKMRAVMQPGGGGPEKLRTMLAQMTPEQLGLNSNGTSGLLNRFQISVLTEGSGTQLFSTTYVQWSAREVLRRAQPLTLIVHFGPRVREASMQELISGVQREPVPDPQGALVDADMGAYYTWINLQRLTGAEKSSFLVWFEDHGEALAIGPSLPRNRENTERLTMAQILNRLSPSNG